MSQTPDPEVGRRVEALRRAAGMSRERLATLAEISAVLIKFVETGRRPLTLRAAQRIAPHLGVRDLAELYGPSVQLTLAGSPTHAGVPEVRRAVTAWTLQFDGEPPSIEYLRGAVDAAWRTWHTSAYQRSETSRVLPPLITAAQRAARLHAGDDRRDALALLAEVYHLAQAYLAWHGDRELMWLCVDRGMTAALDADQPLAIGSASWYAAHLLRAVGRNDEAIERLDAARTLLSPLMRDDAPPEIPSLLADIHLCRALTLARIGNVSAWHDWDAAYKIVHDVLPENYVGPSTRVSRPLVDVYAVMCAVDLGDPDEAKRRSRAIDPASIPSTERRARHYVELARGADMDGSSEGTLHLLQQATSVSPETVAYSPPARALVGQLVADGGATIRAEAQALARKVGADLE